MPTPHKHDWVKITPFGDFKDPKQNHKDVNRNTEQYHLVHLCSKFMRKAGSKNMKALRSHVNKVFKQ